MRPEPDASDWEWAAYGFGYSIGVIWGLLQRLNHWLSGEP